MPIEFACPQCHSRLRVPLSAAGKKARCPQCGAVSLVPMRSEPSVSSAPFGGTPQETPAAPGSGGYPEAAFAPEPHPAQPSFQPSSLGAESPQPIVTPVAYPPQTGYYGPEAPYHYPQSLPANRGDPGMSIAALVLGLIGLIAWCCPLIGFPVGLLALIFGIIGAGRAGKGMAITGIVLGSIVILLSLINAIFGLLMGMADFQAPGT